MPKLTTVLEKALPAHRAKLDTIEALAKTVTEPMKRQLAFHLSVFDKRLDSWAAEAQDKQP